MDGIYKECNQKGTFFCKKTGGIEPFKKALYGYAKRENHDWYWFFSCPIQYSPYYIHFVRKYIATLDKKTQIIFYHYIAGIPIQDTSVLTCMSEQKIVETINKIYADAVVFFEKCNVFDKDAYLYKRFFEKLLDTNIEDDKIAEEFDEEIATVKIARVFALQSQG